MASRGAVPRVARCSSSITQRAAPASRRANARPAGSAARAGPRGLRCPSSGSGTNTASRRRPRARGVARRCASALIFSRLPSATPFGTRAARSRPTPKRRWPRRGPARTSSRTAIGRSVERGADQRRADQAPLPSRLDVQLVDDARIVAPVVAVPRRAVPDGRSALVGDERVPAADARFQLLAREPAYRLSVQLLQAAEER